MSILYTLFFSANHGGLMDGSKQEDTREVKREPMTADEFLVRLGVKKEEDVV